MKNLLSVIFLLLAMDLYAQDSTKAQPVKKGFGVSVSQKQPEFPGGEDSLQAFLKRNLSYPRESKINREQGRVYIGFLVDKSGKIVNPKVLSSASKDLDAEAMRVVKLMPDWQPGTAGGTPVNVQFILPIDFIAPPVQDKQ